MLLIKSKVWFVVLIRQIWGYFRWENSNHFLNVPSNLKISSEDVSNDFWKDKKCFDLSKYPNELEYFVETNKKVIGKFKDQTKGETITDFVSLVIFLQLRKSKNIPVLQK